MIIWSEYGLEAIKCPIYYYKNYWEFTWKRVNGKIYFTRIGD